MRGSNHYSLTSSIRYDLLFVVFVSCVSMVELENCSWCYIYITTVRLFGTCDCSDSYF